MPLMFLTRRYDTYVRRRRETRYTRAAAVIDCRAISFFCLLFRRALMSIDEICAMRDGAAPHCCRAAQMMSRPMPHDADAAVTPKRSDDAAPVYGCRCHLPHGRHAMLRDSAIAVLRYRAMPERMLFDAARAALSPPLRR